MSGVRWPLALAGVLSFMHPRRTASDADVCPWDAQRALELACQPPWPSGEPMSLDLPNDATPGTELSLTVRGEDDPYKFRVPDSGFGGRVVTCDMPSPGDDDVRAMRRAQPECYLAEPPALRCRVTDMWLEGKSGPLFDKLWAGDFLGLLDTFDRHAEATVHVERAEYLRDQVKEYKKRATAALKEVAKRADQERKMWDDGWHASPRDWRKAKSVWKRPMYGKCYLKLEGYANATKALEADTKATFEAAEKEANAIVERRKKLRDRHGDEDMTINGRDTWGRTVLHWAAATGRHLVALSKLREESRLPSQVPNLGPGDNITVTSADLPDNMHWTLLVFGLLNRGAEPNLCDVDGRTPLDLAASAGHAGAVQALLEVGATLNSTNRWGFDAADMARVRLGAARHHPEQLDEEDGELLELFPWLLETSDESAVGAEAGGAGDGTGAEYDEGQVPAAPQTPNATSSQEELEVAGVSVEAAAAAAAATASAP